MEWTTVKVHNTVIVTSETVEFCDDIKHTQTCHGGDSDDAELWFPDCEGRQSSRQLQQRR